MKIRLDDVLEKGRLDEGVERLDQIKHPCERDVITATVARLRVHARGRES
jgi:hypothetical protein